MVTPAGWQPGEPGIAPTIENAGRIKMLLPAIEGSCQLVCKCLVRHVDDFMVPAAPLRGIRVNVAQGDPNAKIAILGEAGTVQATFFPPAFFEAGDSAG